MLSIFYEHLHDDPALMAVASAVGIQGVDGWPREFSQKPARQMRSYLEDYGLSASAIFDTVDLASSNEGVYQQALDQARWAFALAHDVGASHVMLVPGKAASADDKPRAVEQVIRGLRALVPEATAAGVVLGVENFSQVLTPYTTREEVQALLDAVPGLTYTLDTGNFRCQNLDVLEALDLLLPHVERVHVKDWGLLPRGTEGLADAQGQLLYGAPLGCGIIPLKEVLSSLKDTGYTGEWCIEMNNMAVTADDIRCCAAFMQEYGW